MQTPTQVQFDNRALLNDMADNLTESEADRLSNILARVGYASVLAMLWRMAEQDDENTESDAFGRVCGAVAKHASAAAIAAYDAPFLRTNHDVAPFPAEAR